MKRPPVPNFFIAGMPRCGTSSMVSYLKQHPDVYLSPYKEPHFFAKDLNMPTNYIWKHELYLSLFKSASGKKAVGEASVWYLSSRLAAGMIWEFDPEARIIVMLRDPVEQMVSLHSLWVRSGNEPVRDFVEAIELEEKRKRGLALSPSVYFPYGLFYTEVAEYFPKVKRFWDLFGARRIHVILFDDFVRRMPEVYRGTLEFLEVDSGFEAELDVESAAKKIQTQALLHLRHVHPDIREMLKAGMRKLDSVAPPRPPLPAEVEERLRKRFREGLCCLEELIKRDLGCWMNKKN